MATSDKSTFIDVDGCKLHVLRAGKGEPVLFLHGASGGGTWLPFMQDLSSDHEFLAPEHPGFGLSSDPAWLDNVSDLAYFYLDVLEKLNLGPVHLIGTSLGAWMAAEMAVRNTTLIKSLTLVCAVGILAEGQPIDDVFRLPADQHLRRFCHGEKNAQERQNALAAADPAISAKNKATVVRLGWRPRFYNPDLEKWLHRIQRKTLILWGESDYIVPVRFGEAYRQLIPGAEMVVLPRAGHAPYIEEPAAFNAVLRAFLVSGTHR